MARFFVFAIYFLFLAVTSVLLFGPALNGMNDDSIVVWLTSGIGGTTPTAITAYTSIFYGFILKFFYSIDQGVGWHGLIQLFLVISGGSVLASMSLEKGKLKQRNIFYFLILVLSIFVIWFSPRPTFTVTGIFIGFVAFSIYLSMLNKPLNKKIFFFSGFLLIFSYFLRPEASYLAIGFGLLNVFIYLLFFDSFSKKQLAKIFVFLTPIAFIVLLDSVATSIVKQQSKAWANYLEFNELNFKLDTNPSELVFYKKLENGEIPNVDWTSVEAVLYQKNAYFDNKVFSSEVLRIATDTASESIGIVGVINSSFFETLSRAEMYLKESVGFLVLILILITLYFLVEMKTRVKLTILTTNITLLFFVFYYFSAVSRLPARVHLPLIFGVSVLLLVVLLDHKYQKKYLANFLLLSSSAILIFSLVFGQNGVLQIGQTNVVNRSNIEQAILKLNQLDSDGKYVGLLEAFSLEAMLAYGSPKISEDIDYLTSGWMTFSPPWYEKRNSLDLLKNNPYEALAKQPGVYWVSDPVTAEVLNMYMNDREIFRKNKCAVADLHRGLKVYTYQSEKICED